MGIGLDNVVYVETDDLGGMIPERLQEAIQKTLDEGKVYSLLSAFFNTFKNTYSLGVLSTKSGALPKS